MLAGDEDCRAAHMEQRELIKCRRCVTSYHKDCVPDELRDYERVEGMLCLRLWTPINKPMNSKGELDVERQKEEAYMQKCMFREVYQGKARKEVSRPGRVLIPSCFPGWIETISPTVGFRVPWQCGNSPSGTYSCLGLMVSLARREFVASRGLTRTSQKIYFGGVTVQGECMDAMWRRRRG